MEFICLQYCTLMTHNSGECRVGICIEAVIVAIMVGKSCSGNYVGDTALKPMKAPTGHHQHGSQNQKQLY